ncbi:deoxyribonuclease-2-alpha-like [Dermacentor albipictus]|uniref:deoxyribonuclease-2-alpha-like n=1 Tax=Dermacentor albipictus TaxID=60249 RepID=UPI0038FD3297
MKFSLVAALLTHAIASVSCGTVPSSPRCKNQDGQDVDWFIVYKLPEKVSTPGRGEFVYVDSRTSQGPLYYWPLSEQDLYEAQNPVALTLAPLYEKTTRKDILYFVYNDQSPVIYDGTRNGHSKGVLLFDEAVGVWLLHSVPKFVDGLQSGKYSFPENGETNGQLFMCVTFPTPEVNKIAKILRTEYANVYARQVPQSMQENYREVALLAKGNFVRPHGERLFITNLTSAGGTVLRAFGKRASLNKDLYSGVVGNDLIAFPDLYSGVVANDLTAFPDLYSGVLANDLIAFPDLYSGVLANDLIAFPDLYSGVLANDLTAFTDLYSGVLANDLIAFQDLYSGVLANDLTAFADLYSGVLANDLITFPDLYSGVHADYLIAFPDLYSEVLAKDLKDDLAVQSWMNCAGGKLPPDCSSSYTVVHVDSIVLRFGADKAVTFNTTVDHSKWAITIKKGWFCFASTNRMESQKTRGGEALCFDNAVVQALFKFSAIDNTGCPV